MRAFHSAMAAVLLLVAGLAAGTRAADASDWWCWDDPVLLINGQSVQILAGVPRADRVRVRLAEVVVIVPEGVDARIVASPSTWFPLTTRLIRVGVAGNNGTVQITAVLVVQADGEFGTALRVRQASGAEQTGFGSTSRAAVVSLPVVARGVLPGQFPSRAGSR